MRVHEEGRELIRKEEGLRLQSYLCPAGVWTIGWGHTGPDVKPGMSITIERARELFDQDIDQFTRKVWALLKIPGNSNETSAMVSLAYNIGIGAFAKSSVLRLHNAGDHVAASRAFLLWNKATIDGRLQTLPGLVRRRSLEAAMYLKAPEGAYTSPTPQHVVTGDSPAKSRTYWGQGAAVAGGGGMSLVHELKGWVETGQEQLMGLAPYLPMIQTGLVALAIGGVALTLYAKWSDRKHAQLA